MAYVAPSQAFFTGFSNGLNVALKIKEYKAKKAEAEAQAGQNRMKMAIEAQEYEHNKIMNPLKEEKARTDLSSARMKNQRDAVDTVLYPKKREMEMKKQAADTSKAESEAYMKNIDMQTYADEKMLSMKASELSNQQTELDNMIKGVEWFDKTIETRFKKDYLELIKAVAGLKSIDAIAKMTSGGAQSLEDLDETQLTEMQSLTRHASPLVNRIVAEMFSGQNDDGTIVQTNGQFLPNDNGTTTPLLDALDNEGNPYPAKVTQGRGKEAEGDPPVELTRENVIAGGTKAILDGAELYALGAGMKAELETMQKYAAGDYIRAPSEERGTQAKGKTDERWSLTEQQVINATDVDDPAVRANITASIEGVGIPTVGDAFRLENGKSWTRDEFADRVAGMSRNLASVIGDENIDPSFTRQAAVMAVYQGFNENFADKNLVIRPPGDGFVTLKPELMDSRKILTIDAQLKTIFGMYDVPPEFRVPKDPAKAIATETEFTKEEQEVLDKGWMEKTKDVVKGFVSRDNTEYTDAQKQDAANKMFARLYKEYTNHGYLPYDVLRLSYGPDAKNILQLIRDAYWGAQQHGK